MTSTSDPTWIAFAQCQRIALGDPKDVATRVKSVLDEHPETSVAVFDAQSSHPVDIDLRGSLATILKRLPATATATSAATADELLPSESTIEVAPRGPGRPKLGVLAREVTLLPRHWDWLGSQPGGASVALRKLVEKAQRASAESDRRREAMESAYRFMHAMAGDEVGFEEASRALFAGNFEQLQKEVSQWPRDVRMHLLELSRRAV